MIRGAVAGVVVAVVELCAVLVLAGGMASIWELQFGGLYVLPGIILAGAVGGLLGGGLVLALERSHHPVGRVVLVGAVAAFGAAVGWGVGGGRHLATAAVRGAFAAAVGLVPALAAGWLAPQLRRWLTRHPELVAGATALAIVVAEVVNRLVLVRLYPAFHGGLALLPPLLAPLLVRAALGPAPGFPGRRVVAVGAGVVVLAAAALVPAATALARFDNFRLLMVEEAPMAGWVVRGLAAVAPPPPLEGPMMAGPGEAESELSFRGKDILLISIDALRADHVGAYGYRRGTTPHLDALAKAGVVFDQAYAPTPHTSYSVTSLMTGKYMRPLLLQGAGADSDTWATFLRTYGYRTAAFYPPAVFFIDTPRFQRFQQEHLGFEFFKVEFLEGQPRVGQVARYLASTAKDRPVFTWVHLFGPHEPYVGQPGHEFGDRDMDRYDSEIAAADTTVGALLKTFRARSPDALVIVTADHGEEFGDHGGRYHGTTVYEEQVRVPLIVAAPGLLKPRRVKRPVQTIDLLPTVLGGLDVPRPPRIRGRDLRPLLTGEAAPGPGFAFAETDEQALLARGRHRLICARRIGACRLYDIEEDPQQRRDVSADEAAIAERLRRELRTLGASHGRYEQTGLRKEGKGWPGPILRGISGDGDAALDIAALLEDADREIRRKAAQVLFELRRKEAAAGLRLAVGRDEDPTVRRWAALALTRLGETVPLVYEFVEARDLATRRLAALALAETGDDRGEGILIGWWRSGEATHERSLDLLDAFARIKSKDAVPSLAQRLDDVRLRPHIAETLAAIGDEGARIPLAKALTTERYQSAREAIARALVDLGATGELAEPLRHFLAVPDPLPGGLGIAARAGVLELLGGPADDDLKGVLKRANLGESFVTFVPKAPEDIGVRVLIRAVGGERGGQVLVAPSLPAPGDDDVRSIPRVDEARAMRFRIPPGEAAVELHQRVPDALKIRAGHAVRLTVFADAGVSLEAIAVLPRREELPPPEPKAWKRPTAP